MRLTTFLGVEVFPKALSTTSMVQMTIKPYVIWKKIEENSIWPGFHHSSFNSSWEILHLKLVYFFGPPCIPFCIAQSVKAFINVFIHSVQLTSVYIVFRSFNMKKFSKFWHKPRKSDVWWCRKAEFFRHSHSQECRTYVCLERQTPEKSTKFARRLFSRPAAPNAGT